MLNFLFFGVLPYVSLVLFVGVSIVRYRREPFTFSSLSSQFLESKKLFWGSVPFHLGILTLLTGHFVGFLVPSAVTVWNGQPLRLLVLESTAMVAAFLALIGLVGLILRRATSDRLRANTTVLDIVVYVALLFSIVTGLWVALSLRWGSSWYAEVAVPYLWSILKLQPDVQLMADMKLPAQLHVVGAFFLFGIFSFSRLVHVLVAPIPYVWRPTQVVIWNRMRRQEKP